MKIKILGNVIEINNELSEIESAFENLNETIIKSGLNFAEMIIDGSTFYEDYDQYILDNLNNIQLINVILKSTKEILDENLETTLNYLERLFPELDLLVNNIYVEFNKELWTKFSQFFEGLESIMKTLELLLKNSELYNNADRYNLIKQEVDKEIKNLSEAFEIDDRIYISDTIIYEIKPTLEKLYLEIRSTLEYKIK
jgi:hypothetical protein